MLLELVSDNKPVLVGYDGFFNGEDDPSGHEVLAYGMENGSWDFKVGVNGEDTIHRYSE